MIKKIYMPLVSLVVCTVLIASMVGVSFAAREKPKFITISSYPIGSLGTILATAFSDTIEKETGIRSRPTPADTDVGRILPLKTGEAQAAVVTAATIYLASNGKGEFGAENWGPQKLRLVFAGNVIHHGLAVRADSGIKTWQDLKGKKVAMPPGLFSMTIPAFLAYGGLSKEDVILVRASGYVSGMKMVMEGKADAAHTCPVSSLTKEWEAAPYGLRYLPMDPKDKEAWNRMAKYAPFMASPIWADYGGLGEGGPKWLAYYPYTLVSYDTTDPDTVYIMVKALVEGRDRYKEVNKPASEQWTLENTLDLSKPVYIPFHEGLIRYAKEQGKWTPKHEAWQQEALEKERQRIEAWKKR